MTDTTQNQHSIKTVEVLQIAAALAAALRWAIALMPLDGVQFKLSSNPIFEAFSFIMSLAFAAVEVLATAYIMRAWRKETDKQTQSALMALWVIALVLMTFAQVPPLIANIDGVSVATFPLLLKIAWVTAGVAVTFVVIGGVGYAEKSLEAQAVTPPATEPHDDPQAQPAETLNTPAVLVPIADSATEAQPATAADVLLAYYAAQPDANQTQAAQHVAQVLRKPYSRQAVKAQLDRLERDGLIARNGHVEVVK